MTGSLQDPRPRAVVLGASHWHAPLYLKGLERRFRVVAVQDKNPDAVKSYGRAINAPVVRTVAEALAHDDIAVAFVFSPHHQMREIGSTLIDRRIPFVIEKPAGLDLNGLRQLQQEAKLVGVPVTVPLVQRDAPIDTWLRQVGEIVYERMAFIAGPPTRYLENGNPWMLDRELAGGGSLVNLGPHFVDMAIRHLGTLERVVQQVLSTLHGEAVDDHATVIATTSSGREALIEVGYAFPNSPLKRYCSFTAAGSLGFATVDSTGNATFTDLFGSTTTQNLIVDSDPLYDVFVDNVADTLATGFAGLPTLTELVTIMETIWASESVGATARG